MLVNEEWAIFTEFFSIVVYLRDQTFCSGIDGALYCSLSPQTAAGPKSEKNKIVMFSSHN